MGFHNLLIRIPTLRKRKIVTDTELKFYVIAALLCCAVAVAFPLGAAARTVLVVIGICCLHFALIMQSQ